MTIKLTDHFLLNLLTYAFSVLSLLSSCKKVEPPVSCIEVPVSSNIELFSQLELKSCSENADEIEWKVEQPNGELIFKKGETLVTEWTEPGKFVVEQIARSSKVESSDATSVLIIVEDVCYVCQRSTTSQTNPTTITEYLWYSDFDSKNEFYNELRRYEKYFSCSKK